MSASDWQRVRREFERLAELPEAAREAELARVDRIDPELARELRALFRAEALDSAFLAGQASLPDLSPAAEPGVEGRRLGPYELLRPIGEGGMGEVYLARRADRTFEKLVAIKLVRAELASPALNRRFLAERQTLATLEHPGIARLLDGGETEGGRPYLVLEYVEGEPLLEFAERRGLDVAGRLRLFLQVLDAVAYAHRHLVVHRDLKPGNILVTPEGEAKLLDFGIAKLLGPDDESGESATRTLLRALTPEYASPEQLLGATTSTSSDIYSLGVVLFELLAGAKPYRVSSRAPEAWAEAILGQAPQRPSTAAGAARGGEAARRDLARDRHLRGDVDAVVLRALRKEPEARYPTAAAFAEDLRAMLEGRPVAARRGELGYRVAKAARRHRVALAVAALAALTLAATIVAATVRLRAERDRARSEAARAQAVSGFLATLFQAADPGRTRGAKLTAAEVLDQAVERVDRDLADQPETQAALLLVLGAVRRDLGMVEEARAPLERALELRARDGAGDDLLLAEALHELGVLERMTGEPERARPRLERALAIRERELGSDAAAVASTLSALALVDRLSGDTQAAIHRLERAVAISQRLAPEASETGKWLNNLGLAYQDAGQAERAREAFAQAVAILEASEGPASPLPALALDNLGAVLRMLGRPGEALPLLEKGRALVERTWGTGHPQYGNALNSLGDTLSDLGRHEEALPLLEQAAAVYAGALGPEHPYIAWPLTNRAESLIALGRTAEALPLLDRALELRRAAYGDEHPEVAQSLTDLGRALEAAGDDAGAEARLRAGLELGRRVLPSESPALAESLLFLAALLERTGRPAAAQPLFREALSRFEAIYAPGHPHGTAARAGVDRTSGQAPASADALAASRSPTP